VHGLNRVKGDLELELCTAPDGLTGC
jgi:hypothetical protein